jgi:K+-transporting ATPase KdpF subunit
MGDGATVMSTSQAIGLVVAVALLLYFVVAMVRPERF